MAVSAHVYEQSLDSDRSLRDLSDSAVGHTSKGSSIKVWGQLREGTIRPEQQGPRTPAGLRAPWQPLPGLLCDIFHKAVSDASIFLCVGLSHPSPEEEKGGFSSN